MMHFDGKSIHQRMQLAFSVLQKGLWLFKDLSFLQGGEANRLDISLFKKVVVLVDKMDECQHACYVWMQAKFDSLVTLSVTVWLKDLFEPSCQFLKI